MQNYSKMAMRLKYFTNWKWYF